MAQKFWEQPGFKQYLDNRRQVRSQNQARSTAVKAANSNTFKGSTPWTVPNFLGSLNMRTPFVALKKEAQLRTEMAERLRKSSSPAVRQMPDRATGRPASDPNYYTQQLRPPHAEGTVTPGGARRVVPPAAQPRPIPRYKVTPDTKEGQEVYAAYDVNQKLTYLTSRPTDVKVYNYNGYPIFVEKDDSGNWKLDPEIEAMGVKFEQLVPAVYSPDLPEELNYTKTVDELLKPMSVDGMIKPEQPLFYDPILHQITSRPTQHQLFWSRDSDGFTSERSNVWRDGLVHTNHPAVYDDRTAKFLQEMITGRAEGYDGDKTLTSMGSPTTGDQIKSGSGQVSIDQIKAQGTLDYTLEMPEIESINVSREGETAEILATTQQTAGLNLPFGIQNSLINSPVVRTIVGGLAGGLVAGVGGFQVGLLNKSVQDRAMKIVMGALGISWIAITESSNLVKQGPMSSEKYISKQSGFGGSPVAATFSNVLSAVFGGVLTAGAYMASPFVSIFNKDAAQDVRDYAKDMWQKVTDKNTVMGDQLSRTAYFIMEQPVIGWSPTQNYAQTGSYRPTEFEVALHPLALPGEVDASINSLAKYVDKLNKDADGGLNLMMASDLKYRAGLVDEAVDFRTEGIYRYFTRGLDWAAIDNYIHNDFDSAYRPLQNGTSKLLEGDIPVTRDELKFLWRFMVYGQVENSWVLNRFGVKNGFPGPLTNLEPGVNYDFMRHVAKIELQSGQRMTLDQMYDEAQSWLTNWFENPTTLESRRSYLQERSRSIHDRAQSIKDAAIAYSKLGDDNQAASLMKEAENLLIAAYDIDRKSNTLDAYSAYTWDLYPERKEKFYRNLASAELQLGRPLTRQEIIDTSYLSVDVVAEMGGEIFYDVLNVMEFLKVGKVAISAGQKALMRTAMKSEKGVAIINDIVKASDEISQSFLARHIKGRALVSQAHKQAQVASNLFSDVLRSNPLGKEEFIETVSKVADAIQTVRSAGSREEAIRALNTVMEGKLPKTITPRDIWDAAEQLTETIELKKWADTASDVWDQQLDFMSERAAGRIGKRFAKAPAGVADTELAVLRANNIKAEAYKNMRSWSGKNRLSIEIGDKFRRAFSKQHEAWTSSVFLEDTWYAKFGNLIKSPALKDFITVAYKVNQKFMSAWVWATLARRPAWMLYNFIDNTFRFFVSGSGDLRDIMFLMREDVTKNIALEIGIKAEVSTDMAAASFRVLSQPLEGGAKEFKHIPGIDELRQNPLGFLQHYRVNYAALTEGRGVGMHIYSIWRAFPHTVKSLAQTIEYGTRIRMYYKLYTKNIVKINRTLLANLIEGAPLGPGEIGPRIPGLKERLLATGMEEAEAGKWVKYVQDMWWKSGNNGAKFERSLELLSQTGRYKNESMFMPEAMLRADWYDEELHRPLVVSILDELQKFVAEQSKTGVNRLSRAQTDQFFDRVIATLDAEITARMNPIWHQQYEMVHGFDEAEGYKNYKGGPYYPKMEAEGAETITESGHKAIQDIPDGAKTLSNKQRRSAAKAIKDNKVILPNDSDRNLARGVEILRERAEKQAAARAPLTDAQASAIESNLRNNLPSDIPSNPEEALALDAVIADNIQTPSRFEAGARQSSAANEFRVLATPKTFDDSPSYRLLSKGDRDLVAAHGRHLEEQMRIFSGRIRTYWTLSNPGPVQFDEVGRRVARNRSTGSAWDLWDALVIRQYNSQTMQFGELVDGIHSGNFSLLTSYTARDMLERAGITLDFDSQGRMVRMRMYNPLANRWDETTNPAALQRFKKITGVADSKTYNQSIQLMDAAYAVPTQDRTMKIAAKLIPTPFPTYDEMTRTVPRLELAIQEKRIADANRIIAGEFRYPMFFEKGGQLIPSDNLLMNRVWAELGGDAKDIYKTLDDVPPDIAHQIMDRWAQTNHGYEVGKMVKSIEKDMIEVLQKQFGWKEAGAREFFKLYDRVMTNLAKLMSDETGKVVTKDEMWANVFYGFYKMEPGVEGTALRSVDGRLVFQSNLRDFVDRVMTDGSTGQEILANLKLHGFSDAELKWNGMYKWLQDNKKSVIGRDGMRKFIAERERLVTAKIGREGVWDVVLRNSDGDTLATIKGAMGLEADTNRYSLRITKMDGTLDEYSTRRLQRWARDNDAETLIMADGTEIDLRKLIDSRKPLRPMSTTDIYRGSVDFVQNAMDRQAALVKSYSAANITTASHEMFHAVYEYLSPESKTTLEEFAEDALLKLKDAKDPAYRQYASMSPEIARKEYITKAWEKYLITEAAPNAEVGNIFKAIRNYLVNVYKTMKDYFAGVYLTPDVRKVFDNLVDDGWKRTQAAKVPRPRGPRTPRAAITPAEAIKKAKETVTSKPVKKDLITRVADVLARDDIDRAEARWMKNGQFYETPRAKAFGRGHTAQEVIDHEINELRADLKVNPHVDMSTVKAQNTAWVSFDKKIAKKYTRSMGQSARNMPMAEYPYFRMLAVDDKGTALIEFTKKPPADAMFQAEHMHQSVADIINGGDPSEFRTLLLDMLDVYNQEDLGRMIGEMTPIIDGIEKKFVDSRWTILAKDLTPIEQEAFRVLAETFMWPGELVNKPMKMVKRFARKYKDASGNIKEFSPIGMLDLDAITNPNEFGNLFATMAHDVWEPINKGELPAIKRVTDELIQVMERRGFDPDVLVDVMQSDRMNSALLAGWKLKTIDPPNTPEFTSFTAKTKVKGKNGRPLVVYHGSLHDFTKFNVTMDMGHHFGTPYAALDRVRWREGRTVHGYWLNIENPIRLPDEGGWGARHVTTNARDAGILTHDEALNLVIEFENVESAASVLMSGVRNAPMDISEANKILYDMYQQFPILKEHGNFDAEDLMTSWNLGQSGGINIGTHSFVKRFGESRVVAELHATKGIDGIVYTNNFENAGSDSWIAFYKNQIKRVDNVGTYNPKSTDTMFQMINNSLDDYEKNAKFSRLALDNWTSTLDNMLDNPHSLFIDADSGFMNANVMVSDPKALSKPNTAYLIGNGFDYVSKEMGEAAARDYIRAMASALRGSGLEEADIFHMGGARFVIQMDDPKQLDNVLRSIDEAPTVRVTDMNGEMWDVDLNLSRSDVGPNSQIPEQFSMAQAASEQARADAYRNWALRNNGDNGFHTNWNALDDADANDAELMTHPYIRPADTMFQMVPHERWYYLRAELEIEKMDFKSTSTARLRSVLPRFVSADEMKWSGLDDFLVENKDITKQEVLDFLRGNQVEVEDAIHAEGAPVIVPAFNVVFPNGETYAESLSTREAAEAIIHDLFPDEGAVVMEGTDVKLNDFIKHAQWVEPGGTNYHELLLTFPEAQQGMIRPIYVTSHWNEPNVLAHVRFNERVDIEGKRVLFIEEIQSDWHQAGRDIGYVTTPTKSLEEIWTEVDVIQAKLDAIEQSDATFLALLREQHSINNKLARQFGVNADVHRQLMADSDDVSRRIREYGDSIPEYKQLVDQANKLLDEEQAARNVQDKVPDAPFSKNWEELTIKRMVRWASENDYDRVAWTTGAMQNKRYSLTKVVDRLDYDGKQLSGTKLPRTRVFDKYVTPEELPANVGKEVADRLMEGVNKDGIGTLEGVDLEVGGGGMIEFYDVKIPNIAKKYVKKWGSDVHEIDISTTGRIKQQIFIRPENPVVVGQPLPINSRWEISTLDPDTGEKVRIGIFQSQDEAVEFVRSNPERFSDKFGDMKPVTVQGFDVTPEMKRSAMQGQPLFQAEGSNSYFSKAKAPDPQPELDEAWSAFAQAPNFEHGSGRVSLVQLWKTLFGSEEQMLKAGPNGFANITSKLAKEYADREMFEQAELMRILSALGSNFEDYIMGTAIKLDALVPPPLPMWEMNPLIRQWVSNMFGVGSELEGSKKLVRMWKDEFGNNIEESPLANLKISEDASKVLDDIGKSGALDKANLDDVANYGGRIADHFIPPSQGAVTATNFNMIDYTDFSKFDQFMKDLVPFWMYPAKSIPFWIKTIIQHPELVMAYNKYMRWSEMAAVNYNATNSRGEPLPSLRGYVPLLPGLWFNPTAPLMFRYVFPNVDKMPQVDEDLTPLQKMSKFFLDDAPIFGINISPVLSAVLQTLYEPYYPKTNLGYELAKTVIPLEYIPPFIERWFMAQARKIAKGNVNVPEKFQEEVSWMDYLIEQAVLKDALLRMRGTTDMVEKEAIYKEAYAVVTRDESLHGPREEDPIWLAARAKVERSEYYRRIAGMFTGIYVKEFSSGQAELNAIRDEVNTLRDAVNNEVLAALFKPYMSQADIYDAYNTRKYKTPEGWIWSAHQMTRFVADEDGNPVTGQIRRDAIAREATIDDQTQRYYQALKAAADLRDERLLDVPVGANELRDKIMTEYYEDYMKINDPQGLYPLARRDYVLGYKPIEKIEDHITNEWWRQIRSTYPRRTRSETWTQYELRVEAWKDSLPDQAARMSPIFQTNFNWSVFEGYVDTAERMAEVPAIMKKLLTSTNRDGFDQWTLKGDTVVEAIWNAYEALYLKPYYDAVKDKSGNERRLAELQFLQTHTFEPTTPMIQEWINNRYGIDRFGDKLIRDTIRGLTFASPDEADKLKSEPKDPARNKVYDILAWAGPQQSDNYQALMMAYISMGGYESDFDVWWGTGGDVNNYSDVEKYYDFINRVQKAATKVGAQAPDEKMLIDLLQAESDHAEFKTKVMANLGGDFYAVLSMYMFMSSDERKEWRNLNKDLYKKINDYYDMRDDWAKDHPLWATYYYPSFDASTGTSSAGASSGSGGGSGGYGYASNFTKEEAAWWLPMGKRSSLDVMALFTPGKLGSAGVVDKPWWPQSLLDLLDPLAVEHVSAAANGTAQLPKATVTYLRAIAKNNPEFASIIRRNLTIVRHNWLTPGKTNIEMR